MITAALALIICLAYVAFLVWVVLTLLKILTRIAIALERRSGLESPPTPGILSSR
jgi:hypothetical protein